MKTIRASDISAYLYCQRAWWYQKQGFEPDNSIELSSGLAIHEQHGRSLILSGCLRWVALALLLLSVLLAAAHFTSLFIRI